MADINLKTLTPDTSLPKTGFLFGADSQATTDPSVYSTQTVATTLLGSTSLTGDTLTASAPVLNLTQTWNSVGTTFTGMRFNVVSDTSAAASLLMDLQVGGTSQFNVTKAGLIKFNEQANAAGSSPTFYSSAGNGFGSVSAFGLVVSSSSGGNLFGVGYSSVRLGSTTSLSWVNGASVLGGTSTDLFLTRKNTRILQLGEADAATALAQTLSVQSVVAGTSNTAGANFTITGSQGTGSGVGGSIIFQTAAANTGGGATIQNTLANAMVIDSVKTVRLGTGYTVATLPAAGTAGRRTYVTDASAPVYLGTLTGGGAVVCPVFDNGTAWVSA